MKNYFSETEWNLVVSVLSGEAKENEHKQLEALLLSNAEKKEYYEEIRQIWEKSPRAIHYERFNSEQAFEKINTFSETEKPSSVLDNRISLKDIIKVAALIFLVLGFSLAWLIKKNESVIDKGINVVSVRYGEQSHITLSDGTNIWLNSGSKLVYPASFKGKTREVILEGEAYFDVSHDKNRLFIVNTDKIRIKVLGTAFNVKSYPGDNKTETTLVRGSVVIDKKNASSNEAPVILKPGEKVTFSFAKEQESRKSVEAEDGREPTQIKQVSINKVDPSPITSWKEKELVFDNTSLEDMAITLERWFGVKVYLADDTIRHYRYKGKFTHNETIFQVLEIIKITTPLDYDYKNHEITIKQLR
jgi:ferric-dicitrate binding protein FerR (iron transport regulator)